MISNFLMCLGYVPNDGKETVNFMILERVVEYFFSVLLWSYYVLASTINMGYICIEKYSIGYILFFIYKCVTEICKPDHSEQIIIHLSD